MDETHVFVSVGSTANDRQEAFVCAIEDRLRAEGLIPHTVNRNTYTADAPLVAIRDLMERCSGVVVVALERSYFPSGVTKRGGTQQQEVANVILPTPWNQIEAAMGYARGLPLLVILEQGLREEGLLDRGYDWYVQSAIPTEATLVTKEFNGVLASWKEKLRTAVPLVTVAKTEQTLVAVEDLTLGHIFKNLKVAHLWSLLAGVGALVAGAFLIGFKLHGAKF